MGKNGIIQRLVKYVLENILEAEMEDHLEKNKAELTLIFQEQLKNELV